MRGVLATILLACFGAAGCINWASMRSCTALTLGRHHYHAHAWAENDFSSATSGKLFQMTVVQRYKGERRFSRDTTVTRNRRPSIASIVPLACKTWAVVTTISAATTTVRQLERLANASRLCLVVVGDRKTPASFMLVGNNTVYLSSEDQEAKLPYAIVNNLPWSHFGRKIIGYMFAIHHGAHRVYDTDDDNEIAAHLSGIPTFHLEDFGTFEKGRRALVVNPYPCFSSTNSSSTNRSDAVLWPRGFPLESIKDPLTTDCTLRHSAKGELDGVAVIQSLADHDPDVDAIYRLTRKLPLSFGSAPLGKAATIIPNGMFVPFNAQATLYKQRALWGLLLPITVHGRVSDIWRSYITQHVMWAAGLTLAMARPWVVQHRNPHNYLADLQAEQNLYYQAGALVRFLANRTSSALTIPELFESIYIDLYEHGLLEIADVKLARAWLSDLQAVGYVFPELLVNNSNRSRK
jgi:hypothetical protein